MRYVALESCTSKPGRIDVLHYSMFHGTASREDIVYPNSASHSLGDDLSQPIQIDMSGTATPHIFMPSSSMVVSETVRLALASIPNIRFAPVRFRKLVNYPYRAGDFSYYDQPAFRRDPYGHRSDELLKRLPDDPTLHHSPVTHSELILLNMHRKSLGEAFAKTMTISLPHLAVDEINFVYNPLILDQYPMFWSSAIFVELSVFDTIESFIDWDYFTCSPVNL